MSNTRTFVLLFVGILLVLGSVATGIGALEYEVEQVGTADVAPENVAGFVTYEDLDGNQKQIVDRALAGERVVVGSSGELPGNGETTGKLAVDKGDTYHVVTRRLFFNWRTTFGMTSLLFGFTGLAAISEAVRRQQFPHRPVYWIRR